MFILIGKCLLLIYRKIWTVKKKGYNNVYINKLNGNEVFTMSEGMKKEHAVSFTTFLHELQKELHFHLNGGTSYRQKTAELSLQVAHQVGSVVPFFESKLAKETVSRLLPDLDHYRVEDVTKMLHVIAKELSRNANLSDELKSYVQQKHLNRKTLSFRESKRGE
jgi:AraC-like DNA-binding protein